MPSPVRGGPGGEPSGWLAGASSAPARVLAVINQARARARLPGYTTTGGLVTCAGRHNLIMASGHGLSHQCPGEPPLGERETAAGVRWTRCGENVGMGGPVAGTIGAITDMAVLLTTEMLNEKPPDDGHRLNLLSSAFTHVGIAIYRDRQSIVWLTQDFSD